MNTPTKPIQEVVKDSVQSIVNEFPTGNEYESGYKDGYQMGYSVAGNNYGLKWEQAKKALDRIDEMTNPRNKIQYKEFVALVKTIAANTLATWKEEGKEGGV